MLMAQLQLQTTHPLHGYIPLAVNNVIDFTWYIDSKGYKFLPEKQSSSGQKQIKAYSKHEKEITKTRWVIGKGGPNKEYRPLEKFPTLFRIFARIGKSNDVLDFIEKFGPLTDAGEAGGTGEDVSMVIEWATEMESQLRKFRSDRSNANLIPVTNLKLLLRSDQHGAHLTITPSTIIDAMWLQFGQEVTGGGKILRCMYCSNIFRVGPKHGRKTSLYCCDEHREESNSEKRGRDK